jgi:hypothetical protein
MGLLVARVWLPDRPGALGQLASAIGSAEANVVSIDILEQGAGRAIDEIIVGVPSGADAIDRLVDAMRSVDGVAVEDVRPFADEVRDHRTIALETASAIVGASGFEAAVDALAEGVARDLIADWVMVLGGDRTMTSVGAVPAVNWVRAFTAGAKAAGAPSAADDVALAEIGTTGYDIVVGRTGRPLRARERVELVLLAQICAARA